MQTRVLGGEGGRRGFFGGSHSKARVVGLLVVAVVGGLATVLLQGPGVVASVIAAALVYVATARTYRGSPFARWQARRRWRERVRTGTTVFVPVQHKPAPVVPGAAGAPGLRPRPSRQPRLSVAGGGSRKQRRAQEAALHCYRDWPDGAEGMHWLQRGPGEPGIAWHVPTGEDAYLSVAFSVEGQIRGMESDAFLDGAMHAFGELLARYGSESALVSRLQSLTRVVPVDSAFHEAWVWDQLAPDVMAELARSYDEVVTLVATSGLTQRHYVVARWPVTAQFIAAGARRGPNQAGWRALMRAEIDAVCSHLRTARLGRVRPLSAAQLAAVLRHLQLPSWPIDQASDVDVDCPWIASRDEWSATVTRGAGPSGALEETWHRTAVIPITAVETGPRTSLWLAPVLSQMSQQVVRTVSLQSEVVPATEARHAARTDVTVDLADLEAQREKGVLTSDEVAVALAAARSRVEDLRPGSGHHGVGWAGHVTISAPTRAELVEATALITEAAGNAGIASLEWLDTQQAAAMACTWPIGRGMRPVPRTKAAAARGVLAGTGPKEAI